MLYIFVLASATLSSLMCTLHTHTIAEINSDKILLIKIYPLNSIFQHSMAQCMVNLYDKTNMGQFMKCYYAPHAHSILL